MADLAKENQTPTFSCDFSDSSQIHKPIRMRLETVLLNHNVQYLMFNSAVDNFNTQIPFNHFFPHKYL
jgi:hypothetical protein